MFLHFDWTDATETHTKLSNTAVGVKKLSQSITQNSEKTLTLYLSHVPT